ncbi:MAG: ribonuclease HI [Flavobacteriales bacterium]
MSGSYEHPIIIHTDGASKGNPGPGGFGVVLESGSHERRISEGYRCTTNNRMELLAIIRALEALKQASNKVIVYSDSKYVVDAVNKGWVFGWEKKSFKKKKNKDLWVRFLELYRHHTVTFRWVKGHDGNPRNEECDRLAVEAAEGFNLQVDRNFEEGRT